MYILSWIYNCPNITEFHNTIGTLQQGDMHNALTAYGKRRNKAPYGGLKVEYYYNGSYTAMTDTFNSILDKRTR